MHPRETWAPKTKLLEVIEIITLFVPRSSFYSLSQAWPCYPEDGEQGEELPDFGSHFSVVTKLQRREKNAIILPESPNHFLVSAGHKSLFNPFSLCSL
jgi:hypothetical protein